MNLKSVLKILKLNESTISMVLGALVIIVVGLLVVNYFRDNSTGTALPNGLATEETILPTTHTVQKGETLWSISEHYYATGYNWVDIAEANNLSSANAIDEGQVLDIPKVESRLAEASPIPSPEPTIKPTPTPSATPKPVIANEEQPAITGQTYTVVKGDTLWDIAVKAYGDGYRWLEIAKANHLANPNLIHPGNVFILPN